MHTVGSLLTGEAPWGVNLGPSTPCNVAIKNEWNYTSILPYTFMACEGVNLL